MVGARANMEEMMEKYDYKKALKEDILNYIKDNDVLDYEYDSVHDLHEILNDELWSSSVVGNDGMYYDTEEKCAEYLCHNFDLAYEAAREFNPDDNINVLIREYENKSLARYFDCTIRCYLLWECIWDALKELGFKEDY